MLEIIGGVVITTLAMALCMSPYWAFGWWLKREAKRKAYHTNFKDLVYRQVK